MVRVGTFRPVNGPRLNPYKPLRNLNYSPKCKPFCFLGKRKELFVAFIYLKHEAHGQLNSLGYTAMTYLNIGIFCGDHCNSIIWTNSVCLVEENSKNISKLSK